MSMARSQRAKPVIWKCLDRHDMGSGPGFGLLHFSRDSMSHPVFLDAEAAQRYSSQA